MNGHSHGGGRIRQQRVAAELQRLLGGLLRTEVKDPRLDGVTVNDVEVTGDLSVARVYFSTLDPDQNVADTLAGFAKANGFLRGRVGQALRLRRTPELVFVRDEASRRGAELMRLIDSLGIRPDDDRADPVPDDDTPQR